MIKLYELLLPLLVISFLLSSKPSENNA